MPESPPVTTARTTRGRMSDAQMYARFVSGDPAWNGAFFTGVITTGIYCLPSCRARKPKRENVRFFPSCEAARSAGFRACRKCHPDDFAHGADPVLQDVEILVQEVRARPADFADGRALVRRSGFGVTRLFELVRQHYHTTPHDLLLRARADLVKRRLLDSAEPVAALALEAGFESLSVLHEHFRRLNGMTPQAYRDLGDTSHFRVLLPEGYPLGYLRRAFGRDPHSVTERLDADRFFAVVRLDGGPLGIELHLGNEAVEVAVSQAHQAVEAHRVVVGWLGLEQNAAGFARLVGKLGLGRLVEGREGLRLSQTPTVYDGLLWSVLGQQINLAFACLLRRRITEKVGLPGPFGLRAPPAAAEVARLEPEELLPLQFSRQKAHYVVAIARQVASGELPLEELRLASATRAERLLLAVRGLGPWSVNYVMMRALGFGDCVPYGDTGVTSGLQALFSLDERPDVDATRRLMSVFSPHRSLATAHLWQLNRPIP